MLNLISPVLAAESVPEPESPIQFNNIEDLGWTFVNYFLTVAGLVAVVFIIIGGFQYIMSQGNEETSKKAQKTLTFAVIGLVIVLAAYAIKTTVIDIIK
mgnify:CR=1 FL=1